MTLRIAVLASGRGSNLQAILQAIGAGTLDAEVVGVFSDKPAAPALRQVPASRRWSARPGAFPDRAAYEAALSDAVAAVNPDWVVCAGKMPRRRYRQPPRSKCVRNRRSRGRKS